MFSKYNRFPNTVQQASRRFLGYVDFTARLTRGYTALICSEYPYCDKPFSQRNLRVLEYRTLLNIEILSRIQTSVFVILAFINFRCAIERGCGRSMPRQFLQCINTRYLSENIRDNSDTDRMSNNISSVCYFLEDPNYSVNLQTQQSRILGGGHFFVGKISYLCTVRLSNRHIA